jgi:thiol-disulfide isomerase/thioredoxin
MLLFALLATPSFGQEDYERREDLVLEVDGEPEETAEIYFSRRSPSYLLLSPSLSNPVLIEPRSQLVQSVHILKMARQADGTIDLLPGAVLDPLGSIRTEGTTVAFDAEGHTVVLKDKPPLLGAKTISQMEDYSASYVGLAGAYTPDPEAIETLREAEGDIRVRVYFGTWCPFCQRYVPRIMRVARELTGSSVRMDFYGLPQTGFGDDPEASRTKIKAVPTAVIWVDGKEAGRIQGDEWRTPEAALADLLD